VPVCAKSVNFVELLHFSHFYHVSLVQRTNCLLPPQGAAVTDSGEGVCVDPGGKGAIWEAGGPGPPGGGKGWQLASDSGGEET
jgi:hypothetical protein